MATQADRRLEQIRNRGTADPAPANLAPLADTQAQVQPADDREFLLEELRNEQDPAEQDRIMDAIDRLDAAKTVPQPPQETPVKEQSMSQRIIGNGLRNIGAGVELGATIVTSALSEPVAGAAGLLSLLHADTRGDVDEAVRRINDVSEALTFDPRSDRAKKALETVAVPLQALDDKADHVSEFLGFGNPYAQTLIYTSLIGATEFAGLKAGSALKVTRRAKDVQRIADELGIDLTETGLAASIVESAKNMTPGERAANAPALRQALIDAKKQAKAEVEAQRVKANRAEARINDIDAVQDLGVVAREELFADGFNIEGMPVVRRALDNLENFRNQSPGSTTLREGVTERSAPRAQLLELDTVRDVIEAGKRSVKDDPSNPRSVRERLALNQLDDMIQGFVEGQFNKQMIDADPNDLAAWASYNRKRNQFNKNFNEDRTLTQLMDMEATPEQINRWMMGASTAAAKPQAAHTIRRLKEVLGENHSAIKGIKADFLHELAAPLMGETPNFKQFLDNFKRTIDKNPSLVKELGFDKSSLEQLRMFARTAVKMGPTKGFAIINDMPRALTQYFFGHGIARASLRVRTLSNVLRLMLGKTALTRKGILEDVVGTEFGKPAITKSGLAAGRLIQAAAVADIDGAAEDMVGEAP